MYYKDASGSYSKKLFFPKMLWCKVIQGVNLVPFIDKFVEFAAIYSKDLLEACSRTGLFKVSNLTFADSLFIAQFPSGDYKIVLKIYDDDDSNIYNITYVLLINH